MRRFNVAATMGSRKSRRCRCRWSRRGGFQCGRDDGVAEKEATASFDQPEEVRFNVAATMGSRKSRVVPPAIDLYLELQCGRDDGVAEKPELGLDMDERVGLQCGRDDGVAEKP